MPFRSPTAPQSQFTGTSSYYRFRWHHPLITQLSFEHTQLPGRVFGPFQFGDYFSENQFITFIRVTSAGGGHIFYKLVEGVLICGEVLDLGHISASGITIVSVCDNGQFDSWNIKVFPVS